MDPDKVLVFQDEAHFHQTTSVARIWALKGSKPQVPSAPGRRSVAVSGYVFPGTGEFIVTRPSWFNFETVIQSFRDFIAEANIPEGKKAALVIDNAPWHKKAFRLIVDEQLPEYKDIREKLDIIKMPPYSPDLNPIEQCWRVTRREVTHNRYFETLDKLDDTLFSYFSLYRASNDKFRTLCSFSWFTGNLSD